MARFDKDKAFRNIVGATETNVETAQDGMPEPALTIPAAIPTAIKRTPRKSRLIQKSYYITEEQYKALKLKAAMSSDPNEKDLSAVVRAALDAYLKTGE